MGLRADRYRRVGEEAARLRQQAGRLDPHPVWGWLHGRAIVLDGVEGELRYEAQLVSYPVPGWRETLIHQPTERGRNSAVYRTHREKLGDDWVTDLTTGDRWCELAMRLEAPQAVLNAFYAWGVRDESQKQEE